MILGLKYTIKVISINLIKKIGGKMKEVVEVIESYNEYIKKLPNGSNYIAQNLREDKLSDAFQTIKDFSEGLLWLTEAAQLLQINNVKVQINMNQLQEFLIEINEGLEKQDYVLVADLFEYEITPFFEEVQLIEGEFQ